MKLPANDVGFHRVKQLDSDEHQQEQAEQLQQLVDIQQEVGRGEHVLDKDPRQLDCGKQHYAGHQDEQGVSDGPLKFF